MMRDINKAQRQNVVIPYFRVFSDNFKAIALKYGTDLCFKGDLKQSMQAPLLRNNKNACGLSHRHRVATCGTVMVYNIPVACDFRHIS